MAEKGSLIFYLMYAHYPLRMFEKYSAFVEEQLSEEVKKKEETLNSIHNGQNSFSDEEIENILESHKYEIGIYTEEFVNISRSSLVMNVYAFAEKQLIMLCNKNAKVNQKNFNKARGSKGVIENVQTYLEENVGIDFSEYTAEWLLLNDIRLIRNCFAHNSGVTENTGMSEENERKLHESIKRTDGVSINPSAEIQLEKELAIKLCNTVSIILREIYGHTYSDFIKS